MSGNNFHVYTLRETHFNNYDKLFRLYQKFKKEKIQNSPYVLQGQHIMVDHEHVIDSDIWRVSNRYYY